MKHGRLLSVVAFSLFAQACSSDDSNPRRGAGVTSTIGKYDAEHPEWKLHPDALIVQREDVDFVYDVEVQENKLIVPTAGHEEFLARITPHETILISRSNEENVVKNGGFVRRVLSVREDGEKTVFETEQLGLPDIIRGHFDVTQTRPWGVKRTVGATLQSGKVALKKRLEIGEDGKAYYPESFDREFEHDLSKKLEYKKTHTGVTYKNPVDKSKVVTAVDWLAELTESATVKGHVHIAPFIEFYADIDVGLGWNGPDVDIDRARVAMGIEYEAQADLTMLLAGYLQGAFTAESFEGPNMFPGCNIGGVPCGVSLKASMKCEANIGGSFGYRTTLPAKVYGTPRIGGDYYDGDFHLVSGDVFAYQAPEFNGDTTPPSGAKNVFPAGVTKVTMKANGTAQCTVALEPSFYIGEKFGWWKFKADARAGVNASVVPIFRAAVSGCVQRDFNTNQWVNPMWAWGAQGVLQPKADVFLKVKVAGEGIDKKETFDLGGEIEIFKVVKGDYDPLADIDCPAPN